MINPAILGRARHLSADLLTKRTFKDISIRYHLTSLDTMTTPRASVFAPKYAPRYQSYIEKPMGFGKAVFRNFPELSPLLIALSFGSAMAAGFMGYSLYQKPDVMVLPRSRDSVIPSEHIPPTRKMKFLTFDQEYKPIPEYEALKKEIGVFEPGKQ